MFILINAHHRCSNLNLEVFGKERPSRENPRLGGTLVILEKVTLVSPHHPFAILLVVDVLFRNGHTSEWVKVPVGVRYLELHTFIPNLTGSTLFGAWPTRGLRSQ